MTAVRAVPTFSSTGVLGHLSEFRHAPVDLLVRIARAHPQLARIRFGVLPLLVASDPGIVHEILVDKADAFVKSYGLSLFARPLLGQGLLTLERDQHRKRRRLLAPPFMPRRIASYAAEISQRAERSAQRIAGHTHVDVAAETMNLTLEIVMKTLFDEEISEQSGTVGRAFPRALRGIVDSLTSVVPLPPPLPTPANLRLRRAVRELDAIIYRVISEHRQSHTASGDLLSILLEARDQDDGSALSDRELRDEAMTMMLAGHETTANTLAWTLYALARAPELRARVEAELDELGASQPQIGPQHLAALPYTTQVIKESMRMYPAVHMIARRVTRDVQIGPYQLRRGTVVAINIIGIHHRPDLYPDPERFDPERFSSEREKLLPKQAFLPFSAGPRVCIGNHFAMMEAQLIVATWLRQLRFALLEPEQRVELDAMITLRPKGGLPLRVERRTTHQPPIAARPATAAG